MNKKGVSGIIVLILLILIVLASVLLIWAFVGDYSRGVLKGIQPVVDSVSGEFSILPDSINVSEGIAEFFVKREASSNQKKILFYVVLEDVNGNSIRLEPNVELAPLEVRKMTLNYSGLENVIRISLIPYILDEDEAVSALSGARSNYVKDDEGKWVSAGGGGGSYSEAVKEEPASKNTDEGLAIPRKKTYVYVWVAPVDSFSRMILFGHHSLSQYDPVLAKADLDNMPEGQKVWFTDGVDKIRWQDSCYDENGVPTFSFCIWMENGSKIVKDTYESFFTNYTKMGGKMDYVLMDIEGEYITNWSWRDPKTGMTFPEAMNLDPRFKNDLGPRLGISNLSNMNSSQIKIWYDYVHQLWLDYFRNSSYEVIKKYFPNVKMSNYCYTGNDTLGTNQAPCYYNTIFGLEPMTKFNIMRDGINQMRNAARSSTKPISPWFADQQYMGSEGNTPSLNGSELFYEEVVHTLFLNVDEILWWNAWNYRYPLVRNPQVNITQHKLDRMLNEFDSLAGFVDRKTLTVNSSSWEQDFVLSGIYAGGRNVWRFTPDLTDGSTLSSKLVSSSGDIVFRTDKFSVTIPEGEIYSFNEEVMNMGYWVVQSENAGKPLIERNLLCKNDISLCDYPKEGLMGYWKFDGNQPMSDSSGNGNNGICTLANCPTLISSGVNGSSYYFDGNNRNIGINVINKFGSSQITISAWISTNFTFTHPYQYLTIFDLNKIRVLGVRQSRLIYTNSTSGFVLSNPLWYSNGEWHHVVVSYDYRTGNYSFWFDGLENIESYSKIQETPITGTLLLGGTNYGYEREFTGALDEVMVYNRTLSDREIAAIYNSQKALL